MKIDKPFAAQIAGVLMLGVGLALLGATLDKPGTWMVLLGTFTYGFASGIYGRIHQASLRSAPSQRNP